MYGGMPKTNAPFSATVQTTHEQKFADGNAIHGLIVTHEYRDSAELRPRAETSTLCNIGLDGKLQPNLSISVCGPTTKTNMSWQVNGTGEKIVRVHHPPDAPSTPAPPPTEEQRRRSAVLQDHWRKNTRNENLGTRTIAGILCDGSRQITTTPAGEQGNEQPMELMTEGWVAHDSQVTMLRIEDDPRSGRTTTEVTEFLIHDTAPRSSHPQPATNSKSKSPPPNPSQQPVPNRGAP